MLGKENVKKYMKKRAKQNGASLVFFDIKLVISCLMPCLEVLGYK
jgi:aerobic-type carbon monoxide dehydrogenase small subunit (CoxS/CutS family)